MVSPEHCFSTCPLGQSDLIFSRIWQDRGLVAQSLCRLPGHYDFMSCLWRTLLIYHGFLCDCACYLWGLSSKQLPASSLARGFCAISLHLPLDCAMRFWNLYCSWIGQKSSHFIHLSLVVRPQESWEINVLNTAFGDWRQRLGKTSGHRSLCKALPTPTHPRNNSTHSPGTGSAWGLPGSGLRMLSQLRNGTLAPLWQKAVPATASFRVHQACLGLVECHPIVTATVEAQNQVWTPCCWVPPSSWSEQAGQNKEGLHLPPVCPTTVPVYTESYAPCRHQTPREKFSQFTTEKRMWK